MKEIVEAPIPTISDKQKDKESNDERLNPTKAVEPLPAAKERRPGRRIRGNASHGIFHGWYFFNILCN